MTIYGGGWFYDRRGKYSRKQIYDELIEKGIFFTDYTPTFCPKVVDELSKAKVGDIIYLKSYIIKTKTVKIQAIGRFTDIGFVKKTIGGQEGTARSVDWKVKEELLSDPISIKILSPTKHNTTFYEETNVEIIEKIMKRLNEE